MKQFPLVISFIILIISSYAQQRGTAFLNDKGNSESRPLYKESHALLIGVSDYNNEFPYLHGVEKDIASLQEVLSNMGFSVLVLKNPTHNTLDSAFLSFILEFGKEKDNRLLFYFAGHGFTEKKSNGVSIGYICPANTPNPSKDPRFSLYAIPLNRIEYYEQQIECKHALFIFDACFAGQLYSSSRSDLSETITFKTLKPVREYITSGSADETVPDQSIFCESLINALSTDVADSYKDGYLTCTELAMFLETEVINKSKNTQHPQFYKSRVADFNQGDFVFKLNDTIHKNIIVDLKQSKKDYGTIELTTEMPGDLFIDNKFFAKVNKDNVCTIKNLELGDHILKVEGSEIWKNDIELKYNGEIVKVEVKKKIVKDAVEMVFIKGGTFAMGSDDIIADPSESPAHWVELQDFYLGKYEITQSQWQSIMGNNPAKSNIGPNFPVESISWDEIQAFIRRLNDSTNRKYRLPTEAEWEYACKAGRASYFNTGDCIDTRQANFDGNYPYINCNVSMPYQGTTIVGKFPPNNFGLYDMHGNVWEWCSDRHGHYSSLLQRNPKGPPEGNYRVYRGGSWRNEADKCRSTFRGGGAPKITNDSIGFRLALDIN
jgi:formylglycine-generating enzyme required for sulfatase activity